MSKPYYPGKTGPAPTGLKRPILFPFMLNDMEFEWLKRISIMREKPATEIIREIVFTGNFIGQLDSMRAAQGPRIESKRGRKYASIEMLDRPAQGKSHKVKQPRLSKRRRPAGR